MNEYRDQGQDKDWERISELLHRADCVPDAPDCRAAVMAKIARPRPARRFAWAYASGFAALLVAAFGFAPFLMNSDKSEMIAYTPRHAAPAPETASEPPLVAFDHRATVTQPRHRAVRHARFRKPTMMAKAAPVENTKAPILGDRVSASAETKAVRFSWHFDKSKSSEITLNYERADGVAKVESSSARVPVASLREISPSSRPARSVEASSSTRVYDYADSTLAPKLSESGAVDGTVVASAAPAKPATTSGYSLYSTRSVTDRAGGMALRDAGEEARPVAVAMVTWPSAANRNQDSSDYSYVDRDTATGTTTECRVKRSGNSVEIYLESKPAAPQPPVKGSLDHETKPSV